MCGERRPDHCHACSSFSHGLVEEALDLIRLLKMARRRETPVGAKEFWVGDADVGQVTRASTYSKNKVQFGF